MTDEDPTPEAAETTAAVANVSVKLPPFWASDPEVWFAQVEAHFTTRRITAQKTRFDYVVASLSPEIATEIRDLILKPPESNPYNVLKEQLIKRTASSKQRRFQQLFNLEDLGDRKPTQLLRRMQQLVGDRAEVTDGAFLRELFLQRLPPNVRMVLASTSTTVSLEELAELADKIVEVAIPTVSATTTPQPYSQLLSELEQLRTEVKRLQQSVQTRSRQPRGGFTSRSRQSSPAPSQASDAPVCWYHQTFGEAARKCNPPCSFLLPSNELAGH